MDTFASTLRRHARARPAAPALSFGGQTQSFAELDASSSRAANLMLSRGVAAGDRVAVLAKNCAAYFEVLVGASKIGATVVGLNWRLSPREMAEILADADPKLLFHDERGAQLLPAEHGWEMLAFGAGYAAARDAMPERDPEHRGLPDEIALILYTSGTTGLPKGVMLTNEAMSYTARLAEAWGMTSSSVNLVAMPLFHIGGCGYGSSTFMAGGHTVLISEVDVGDILDLVPKHGVTHTFLVPAVVQMMLNSDAVRNADLSSLELLMYGASPMGDVLLRRAIDVLGCNFMHAYGMTESAGTVVILPPDMHDPDGPRPELLKSCGKPLPWVSLRIIDPATGRDAALGKVGEIWLKTAMIMKGYWNNPAATREVFAEDGWFRTGDAAYLDEDGYIYLFDRFKDMIISGGENIYPAEIENVLNGHEAVAQVAVIGVPHEKWGETPLAFVVLRPGRSATPEDLIAYTRRNLATYKCPSTIKLVETLPRNATGKLLKPELRRLHGVSG
ncbi:long-chain-fatty-acid--CoA ligase [Aquibium carbonis]|uniref:3-methylmercaptopropionyl-CoA ligase n=1 Tax=Aquibium carbonis TaxID=2495581 RepID=A0A3R9YH96_9HYPH|nr:long-chain fatty acid--CoA ligase [Aquibium carbonis]RST87697.1 long-chain-fatty-acid--CoA ligase [Aquibium carbonis]